MRPSPGDMAVPAQLLANGAATGWFPLPDSMPAPDLGSMCSLLAEHLKRLKGSSSSGLEVVATPFLNYAVCHVSRAEGCGFDVVHVLLPLLAQIFLLSIESARVPADWKVAKITPLYKKGPMLDPNSYRMLASTMYRLNANVIRSLLTTWCISKSKILDTQFGIYPGRNTLNPMFILEDPELRHLQHAARTIKPSNSSRLHTTFIDFKQAYDTIPRQALWSHFRCIRMPAISCLLFKACMLVTSTSFTTGVKLHGLSLLWV